MSNFLQQILGVQPAQAQGVPAPQTYDAATERRARASGFRSANEMMLWAKNREQPGGSIDGGKRPSISAGISAAKALHPANILGYVLSAMRGATGN